MAKNPTGNARFIDLGEGLLGEMMTHQIQLFYDPTTEKVRVIFNGYIYILTGNVYRKVGDENDILHVDLAEMMGLTPVPPNTLVDPVTGTDLSKVSVAGVVLIIKAAYDYFYNRRAQQRQTELEVLQQNAELQRQAENPPLQLAQE